MSEKMRVSVSERAIKFNELKKKKMKRKFNREKQINFNGTNSSSCMHSITQHTNIYPSRRKNVK